MWHASRTLKTNRASMAQLRRHHHRSQQRAPLRVLRKRPICSFTTKPTLTLWTTKLPCTDEQRPCAAARRRCGGQEHKQGQTRWKLAAFRKVEKSFQTSKRAMERQRLLRRLESRCVEPTFQQTRIVGRSTRDPYMAAIIQRTRKVRQREGPAVAEAKSRNTFAWQPAAMVLAARQSAHERAERTHPNDNKGQTTDGLYCNGS